MIDLRTYLEKEASSLKVSLDNSWRIAEQEWIPLLKVDSDSYAGAPHLHSVESWLNRLAEQCQPEWSKHSTMPFGLNAAELYILLAGVLFHDIGRAAPFIDKNHGSASRTILEGHWARLGIKDARFAREIGLVAEFHTREPLVWENYSVPNILPWGPIHTHSLGALLVLADELDTAFNRVAPEYMRNPKFCWERRSDDETIAFSDLLNEKELLGKGFYRNYINSVEFDVKSHIIKTSVRNNALPGGYLCKDENSPIFHWQQDCKKRALDFGEENEVKGQERLQHLFFHYLLYFSKGKKIEIADFLAEKYFSSVEFKRNQTLHKLDWLGINNPLIADSLENSFFWKRRYHIVPPNLITKNRYYLENFGDLQKFCKQSLKSLLNYYKDNNKNNEDKTTSFAIPQINADNDKLKELCKTIYLEIVRLLLCHEETKKKKYSYEYDKLADEISKINPNENDIAIDDKIISYPKQATTIKVSRPKWFILSENSLKTPTIWDLFHCLSFLDLKSLFKKENAEIRDINTIKPYIRHPEAWSFCDYADNLTIALHICVALVRKDLECAYIDHPVSANDGADQQQNCFAKFESLFPKGDQSCTYFTPPPAYKKAKKITEKKDFKVYLDEELDKIDNTLKATAKLWKDHLSFPNEKINVREIDLAFQFIFMLWLSGDVKGKQEKLEKISEPLQRVYVPFTNWLIEYNNQLYDTDWKLVLEPVIKYTDLLETFIQLKDLWFYARDTEKGQIPFESLSAKLHQIDPKIINLMTDRLHNLLYLLPIFKKRDENDKSKPYFFDDMMRARLQRKDEKFFKDNDLQNSSLELNCGHTFWSFEQENDNTLKDFKDMEKFLKSFESKGDK